MNDLSCLEPFLFTFLFFIWKIITLMILMAEPLVNVLLGGGEKWSMVALVLPIIAPLIVTGTLIGKIFDTLTLLGKVKILFYYEVANGVLTMFTFLVVYYIFGDFIIALAIEIRCFCPPESVMPRSPNLVS